VVMSESAHAELRNCQRKPPPFTFRERKEGAYTKLPSPFVIGKEVGSTISSLNSKLKAMDLYNNLRAGGQAF
ncbi:MAG: hypothetical protein ACI8RD_011731, partial [Bacillariaceae sp.]|jgi:hypothetical protein